MSVGGGGVTTTISAGFRRTGRDRRAIGTKEGVDDRVAAGAAGKSGGGGERTAFVHARIHKRAAAGIGDGIGLLPRYLVAATRDGAAIRTRQGR